MAIIPFLSSGPRGNQARFASAHAARSFGWAMTDLLLAWHLHVVVGFSGVAVSVLLTILLSIGALANFCVGYLLTALHATAQVYVRFQLAGSIATAILLAAQFLMQDSLTVPIVAIAFRIAFAIQDVPQSALGSLLPVGNDEAKRYAQIRVTLSGVTRVLAILMHLLMLGVGWRMADIALFVVIGVLNVASALDLRGLRFPGPLKPPSILRDAPRSWPEGLQCLLMAFSVSAAVLPTISRLLIFTPQTSADVGWVGSWMLVAFCCGSVFGPLLQRRLADVLGDSDALVTGLLIVMASAVALTFADGLPVRVVATLAHGAGLSIIGVHLWATAARIAMDDAACGPRRDGLVVGWVILTTHLSMAFGSLLLAPLIDGYEADDPAVALSALMLVGGGAAVVAKLLVRQRTVPVTA